MAKTLKIVVTGTANPSATPIDGQYPVAFIRKQLLAGEVYPNNIRFNPTTEETEFSPDGGTTWIPSPGDDPRYQSPGGVQTGTDAACNNAASEVAYLLRVHGVLQSVGEPGMTATRVAFGLLTAFLQLPAPWAVVWNIFFNVATTMISVGLTAINAAFSTTNMDILRCILFCEFLMGEFGSQGLGNVDTAIDAQIGGTNALILKAVINLQNFGGINQAALLALDDTQDCSGCGCTWCYDFDFTVNPEGFISNSGATFNPPFSTVDIAASGHNSRRCQIRKDFASSTLTKISMVFTYTAGTFNTASNRWAISYQGAVLAFSTTNPGNGTKTVTWTGTQAGVTAIGLAVATCDRTAVAWDGAATIRSCHVEGTGTNPFGSSNC